MTRPRRILLATDLSGRGDRALDRATQLADAWDSELVVVHALDGDERHIPSGHVLPSWRRPPDSADRIEQQIRGDVRGPCPRLRVHVEEGEALPVILDAIEREAADLVIVGMGRHRPLGGVSHTIDELFRRSPASVLVVKRRPHGPYGHVLVGTDFTDEARRGLETAAALFPHAVMAVMHAYEMPYRALLLDSQLSRDYGEMERRTIRDFVAEADIAPDVRDRIVTLIEHGAPEAMLGAYVLDQGADLTVVGAYERNKLFHVVVGRKGPRIVDSVPSDVLVVRAQRPPKAAEA